MSSTEKMQFSFMCAHTTSTSVASEQSLYMSLCLYDAVHAAPLHNGMRDDKVCDKHKVKSTIKKFSPSIGDGSH